MRIEAEFFVRGNHGIISVDAESGTVLSISFSDEHERQCDECRLHNLARFGGFGIYGRIVKFDLDEWLRKYQGEGLPGISVDILDLGYWDDQGTYTDPAADWRQDFRRAQ